MRIHILLGGFLPGPDGWIDSAGMHELRAQLAQRFPAAIIKEHEWSSFEDVAAHQSAPFEKFIVIGYSGGGSRATWLASKHPNLIIHLMVLYDPSPTWQMVPITHTGVKRAICYHNRNPFFFGLGGGSLIGPQVETFDISENHMIVQTDPHLHARTLAEIAKLAP